ncbi:MAG: DsbA family protein [Actinomycetota bacterium]|nr:DsbA family protein [Actinomycetota bacterium]
MELLPVFADVSCPFAHVGLRRFVDERTARGLGGPVLSVRAWPLELVNGKPMAGESLIEKIAALREEVAPGRFAGFDPAAFPATTLPAMAGEVAARRHGDETGERFSLAIRDALFERGLDVGDPVVVDALLTDVGAGPVLPADADAVLASHREGLARQVKGSPHFFVGTEGFFCPSLDISHDDEGYDISFDFEGFTAFLEAALEPAT